MSRLAIAMLLFTGCSSAERTAKHAPTSGDTGAAVGAPVAPDTTPGEADIAPGEPSERTPQCDDGYACFRMSAAYATGEGVAEDDERALALLGRSCSLGYAGACATLYAYAYGAAAPAYRQVCEELGCLERATEIWARRCASDDDVGAGSLAPKYACLGLAELAYLWKRDAAGAFGYAKRSCALGSGRGCEYAADLIDAGKVNDANQALDSLRERAEVLEAAAEPQELWP